MGSIDWPRLPIQPEDLPKIRELMSAEEYARLLKRLGGDTERRWLAITLIGRQVWVPSTHLQFPVPPTLLRRPARCVVAVGRVWNDQPTT